MNPFQRCRVEEEPECTNAGIFGKDDTHIFHKRSSYGTRTSKSLRFIFFISLHYESYNWHLVGKVWTWINVNKRLHLTQYIPQFCWRLGLCQPVVFLLEELNRFAHISISAPFPSELHSIQRFRTDPFLGQSPSSQWKRMHGFELATCPLKKVS